MTPRRRRIHEAAASATADVYRREILAAAGRVFGKKEFAEAKMADIAREAGLAAGTLYNYFENKEQIFRTLLEESGDEVLRRVEALFDEPLDPLARLRKLVETGLHFFEENQHIFWIVIQLGDMAAWSIKRIGGAGVERNHERAVALQERAIREAIAAGVLRDDIPPETQVTYLHGCIKETARTWIARAKGAPRAGLVEQAPVIMSFLLRGLGAPAR
jgi:AcrR family transcriptional regulator